MNESSTRPAATVSIAAVERDTGLAKDTLRVWERRYGFPAPLRDAAGERGYSADDVDRLRLVKRLLEAGHRPGRVVPLPLDELKRLAPAGAAAPRGAPALEPLLALVRGHDNRALAAQLRLLALDLGLARFVIEIVAPLNMAIGDGWLHGRVEVYEEHLYTETVQVVLRQAIAAIPDGSGTPRVLLSTLPGEPHALGLLMAEALFALHGCRCTSLGVQTPVWDIVQAASACASDIVALGFSGCMNPNLVVQAIAELRGKLPPRIELWTGGGAPVLHRRRVDGVLPLVALERVEPELARWHATAGRRKAYTAT